MSVLHIKLNLAILNKGLAAVVHTQERGSRATLDSMSWGGGENRQGLCECVCGERGGVEVRWLVRWQSKQQISPIKVAGRRAEGCNWYHCHQLIIEEIKWLLKLLSNLDFLSRSQDINIPVNSLLEALRSDKNIMCEWLLSVGWILWDSKHLCSTLHITHVETHIVKLSSWLKSSTKQREQRITLVRLENERHSSESDQISEMKSRDVSTSYMFEFSNSILKY